MGFKTEAQQEEGTVSSQSVAEIEAKSRVHNLVKHQTSLTALWVLTLAVGWRPLFETFALAVRDDEYTHILLILPVSATLLFLQWRSLRSLAAFSIRAGSALLVIALFIASSAFVWSASLTPDVRLTIWMFALVVSWIGAFELCFGSRALQSALFPFLFLFGMVPFPQALLDWIVALLQQGSAGSAQILFQVFGVPVTQDGVSLTIPGLTLVVAPECSSIRSSSMLVVTTMVLAHLLLRSPWRKALVICIAIPLSVAKNGLRIFSLAMLGTKVDSSFLTGPFHHQGGIIFLAIAQLIIFALLWVLRKGEDSSPKPGMALSDGKASEERTPGRQPPL